MDTRAAIHAPLEDGKKKLWSMAGMRDLQNRFQAQTRRAEVTRELGEKGGGTLRTSVFNPIVAWSHIFVQSAAERPEMLDARFCDTNPLIDTLHCWFSEKYGSNSIPEEYMGRLKGLVERNAMKTRRHLVFADNQQEIESCGGRLSLPGSSPSAASGSAGGSPQRGNSGAGVPNGHSPGQSPAWGSHKLTAGYRCAPNSV